MPAQTRTRSATKAGPVTEKPSVAAIPNGSGKSKGKGKATALPQLAQTVDEDEADEDEDEDEGEDDDDLEAAGSEDDSEADSDLGEGDEDDEEDDDEDSEQEDSDSSGVDEATDEAASKPSTSRPPPSAPLSQAPTASSSSSARLDPSLFKAYFSSAHPSASSSNLKSSLKKTAPLAPPTQAELREAREQRKAIKVAKRRREERKGGVVRGRDGLPMRRLGDGRTVVRSLDQVGRRGAAEEGGAAGLPELPKELYLPASSARGGAAEGDLTNALAAQKSKRFLKRKLGTGASPLTATSSSSSATTPASKKKKAATSADDPLGLEDPAFLPGGEFAHLGNLTGKKKRRGRGGGGGGGGAVKKFVSKSDLRGDALRGLPGRMGGAAMVFNRSAR